MNDCISKVSKEYPCREEFIGELYKLLGNPKHRYPSSIYIQGPPGVGKQSILKRFLINQNINYALINAIEYYTSKLLYEAILNQLTAHEINIENNFANSTKCESIEDFIDELNGLNADKSYVIILKNHERIHSMDKHILPVLLRLNQVCMKLNICCILIGCKPSLHHTSMQALPDTKLIHCSQYSKNDLMSILQLQEGFLKKHLMRIYFYNSNVIDANFKTRSIEIIKSLDSNFFAGYFDIFLNFFYRVCRNVRELLYLSNEYFPTYCRPVIEETIGPNDSRKLWKHMEIPFQRAMNSIYCRMEMNEKSTQLSPDEDNLASQPILMTAKNLELPYYTKYLLIAAYLASHNEAKSDKRLFMKHHGKQRKRLQSLKAKAKVSEAASTQVGPKAFKIDRMLAIFYAIVEEKVPLTSILMMQISNLVRLNYLTFISNENCAIEGSAKLKCTATLNLITQVGKQVNFNVRKYLCDFI